MTRITVAELLEKLHAVADEHADAIVVIGCDFGALRYASVVVVENERLTIR